MVQKIRVVLLRKGKIVAYLSLVYFIDFATKKKNSLNANFTTNHSFARIALSFMIMDLNTQK